MELWHPATGLDAAARASALASQMDLAARDARMAVGSDQLSEAYAAQEITKVPHDYFVPGS